MDLPVRTPILHTHHIHIPDIRMHTMLPMEFPRVLCLFLQLSCYSSSRFKPFPSIRPFLLSVHFSVLKRRVCQFLHYSYTSPWRQWFPCPHFAVNSSCESALHCSSKQQTLTSRWQHCHRWVHCLPQKKKWMDVGLNDTDVRTCVCRWMWMSFHSIHLLTS